MSWAQKQRTEQYTEDEAAAVQQGREQHEKTTQSSANAARVRGLLVPPMRVLAGMSLLLIQELSSSRPRETSGYENRCFAKGTLQIQVYVQ